MKIKQLHNLTLPLIATLAMLFSTAAGAATGQPQAPLYDGPKRTMHSGAFVTDFGKARPNDRYGIDFAEHGGMQLISEMAKSLGQEVNLCLNQDRKYRGHPRAQPQAMSINEKGGRYTYRVAKPYHYECAAVMAFIDANAAEFKHASIFFKRIPLADGTEVYAYYRQSAGFEFLGTMYPYPGGYGADDFSNISSAGH